MTRSLKQIAFSSLIDFLSLVTESTPFVGSQEPRFPSIHESQTRRCSLFLSAPVQVRRLSAAFPSTPYFELRLSQKMEFSSSPPASRRRLAFEDLEDDELSVVEQSPYFTQPTQVIENPASRPQPVTSSPKSIVEVPASSPFRPQALQQRPGRLANMMAPAGTTFRPPACQPLPLPKVTAKREYIMISDDELDAPLYAGGDSSDDDTQPSRGDIRPSSFRRKEPAASNAVAEGGPQVENRVGFLPRVHLPCAITWFADLTCRVSNRFLEVP